MPLSMQDFAGVVEALRSKSVEAHHGSERRMTQRIGVQTPIDIMPLQGPAIGNTTRVVTIDISPESLGLLSGTRLEAGQQFLAVLPRLQKNAIVALYTAARITSVVDGVFSIGATLKADAPRQVLGAIESIADPRLAPLRQALEKLAGPR